mgnify:CR=1 FL=1|jgi:hypothetical protein
MRKLSLSRKNEGIRCYRQWRGKKTNIREEIDKWPKWKTVGYQQMK